MRNSGRARLLLVSEGRHTFARGLRGAALCRATLAFALLAVPAFTEQKAGRAQLPGSREPALVGDKARGSPARNGEPAPASGLGDTIVILQTDAGRYSLQELPMRGHQRAESQLERELPPIPGGYYSGPVAMASTACAVIGCWSGQSGHQEVRAYQYQIQTGRVSAIGVASPARPGDMTLCLLSSTASSGDLLVAMRSPEIIQDPPWSWAPRTDRWRRLVDVYPAVRKTLREGSSILTAALSPDGSLLAIAVECRGEPGAFDLWTYGLGTHELRKLMRLRHGLYVRLALSPRNSELLWEDVRGFGIVSLANGRSRCWPPKEMSGLPERSSATQGAFAADGKRVYFVVRSGMESFEPSRGRYITTWLAAFDPSCARWQVIWKSDPGTELVGFAVMPGALRFSPRAERQGLGVVPTLASLASSTPWTTPATALPRWRRAATG